MAKVYRQLSLDERVVLQTQLSLGLRPAAIAAGLKRARSTITREMRRNGWKPAVLATPPAATRHPLAGTRPKSLPRRHHPH